MTKIQRIIVTVGIQYKKIHEKSIMYVHTLQFYVEFDSSRCDARRELKVYIIVN